MNNNTENRRSEKYTSENSDRWLISYADFITLMFAFFVILYATSDVNKDKSKNFQDSIKKYLVPFGAGGGPGEEVNQGIRENSPIDAPIKAFPSSAEQKTKDTLEKTEVYIEDHLLKGTGKELIQDIAAVEAGVKITLNGAILFSAQSTKFREEAMEPLDKLCRFLVSTSQKLIIESHTNKGPVPDSSFASQWEFAASRATAFIRYLIRRYSYPADRLAAVSYGSERPLFPESDQKNMTKNQRLEVLILTNENIF